MEDVATRVVAALSGTRKAIQLYPPAHPAHREAVETLVACVRNATRDEPLVLNWHQGHLYHGSDVLAGDQGSLASIAEALESRCIESLEFSAAFCETDAIGLTQVLMSKPSPDLDVPSELAARGVAGVTIRMLSDHGGEEREERNRQRAEDRQLYQRFLSDLKHVQERLSAGASPDLSRTSSLVGSVIERLLADPGAMLGLATIRSTGEHGLFHSLNVTIYALLLGQRLGLPDEGLHSLGLSALLHDVGKAAFDPAEPGQAAPMHEMHPKVGADILQRVALEDPAPMLVAFEHHMGVDGSGWPERPNDYVAHPFSRMVSVANRFHNLTDPGNGTAALTPDRAVVQLMRESNGPLDPVLTRLFVGALGVFPVGCLVRLSDQTVGVVSRPGASPLEPTVRVTHDARGLELADSLEVDLDGDGPRIVEVIEPETLDLIVSDKL